MGEDLTNTVIICLTISQCWTLMHYKNLQNHRPYQHIWPLKIIKWLPITTINWHILFVLIKTNTLKNKFVKIGHVGCKIKSYDFVPLALLDPLYLGNGKSYFKFVGTLLKDISIRNLKKKTASKLDKHEHSTPKIMTIPISRMIVLKFYGNRSYQWKVIVWNI